MNPEQRKKLLSMAQGRAKPGSGSGVMTLKDRSSTYGSPDLHFLLGHFRFLVVGGLATRLYMPERMTLDTDILISLGELPQVEAQLATAGCERLGPWVIGGSTWRMSGNQPLDVVALEEAWVEEALGRAVTGPDGLPYAALPYLVLMKLKAGRLQDLADISRMLGAAESSLLEQVRRSVRIYRPEDLEDLESLAELGRLEQQGG